MGRVLGGLAAPLEPDLGGMLGRHGGHIFFLLGMSSVESLPSAFGFNTTRVAQSIIKTSDYQVVVNGFLMGIAAPLMGLGLLAIVVRHSHRLLGPVTTVFMGLVLLGLILGIIGTAPAAASSYLDISRVVLPRQDLSEELTPLPGFQVKAYLPLGINKITSIAFDSKDRLFVASQNGVVATVVDTDADGIGDEVGFFASTDGGLLGIAISEDDKTVYLAVAGDVLKVEDRDLDGTADHSQLIIDGLPSFVYSNHSNNGLAIGPDGRLYMTLGATSNSGPEDHPLAGSILVSNLDGSDLRVYARGMRNPYDLVFTSTGLLIASDNGPDGNFPDELNLIQEEGNYGYPDFFGYPPEDSGTIAPIYLFPDHSVPTGNVEYVGGQFPAEYERRIFIALFQPPNSKVVSVTLQETQSGEIRAVVEDFLLGMTTAIDVAIDSLGRLYVADFSGGQVYQVSWVGDQGEQ